MQLTLKTNYFGKKDSESNRLELKIVSDKIISGEVQEVVHGFTEIIKEDPTVDSFFVGKFLGRMAIYQNVKGMENALVVSTFEQI